MKRDALAEFDMVEDVLTVPVRTFDLKITRMPVKCGKKLVENRSPATEGERSYVSFMTVGKSVMNWSGYSVASPVEASTESDILDIGCSTEAAANFIVRYVDDTSQLDLLRSLPKLLMEVLELAFAIGADRLFFDGCLIFGELLKELTRAPLVAVLDGSVPCSELLTIFRQIVNAARDKFNFPRMSPTEDDLLEAEIEVGRCGATISTIDPSVELDRQVNVERFDENLKHVASFQTNVWQPNGECLICPDCGVSLRTYFGMQKVGAISHCRSCGKGKCSNCVKYRVCKEFATVERPNDIAESSPFRKVCAACFKDVANHVRFRFLSNAFMLSGLGILEISILRFVCGTWRGASELCLREYHNMLYASHFSTQNKIAMRRLIFNSAIFFRGHPQAIVFLSRVIDWSEDSSENEVAVSVIEDTARGLLSPSHHACPIPHLQMFCTRACPMMVPEFCGFQLLEALQSVPHGNEAWARCKKTATRLILCGLSGEAITLSLVPLLMDCASFCTESLDCLIEIGHRNPRLALSICLEAESRGLELSNKILQPDDADSDEIRRTGVFLQMLNLVDTTSDMLRLATSFIQLAATKNMTMAVGSAVHFLENDLPLRPFKSPFDHKITICAIRLGSTTVKRSNSRPTMYTLVDTLSNVYKLLHKKECVRKDAVVSSIVSILHQNIASQHLLWQEDRDGEISLPNYQVIPTGPRSGVIQIVEGQTLQHIYNQSVGRVRNGSRLVPSPSTSLPSLVTSRGSDSFVPQDQSTHQDTASFGRSQADSPLLTMLQSLGPKDGESTSISSYQRKVGRRFLASAKVFLVVNYLLAIGDRHRDNVVLTPEGYILHIDFGFLLGSRPLPEKQLLGAKSYVRFDGDLDLCVRHYQKLLHNLDGVHHLSEKDAIDGFLGQTADLFIALRPHTYAILILLQHLIAFNALDENTPEILSEKMRNITMGGSAQNEAKKVFIKRIRDSIGAETLRDWVYTKARSMQALLF